MEKTDLAFVADFRYRDPCGELHNNMRLIYARSLAAARRKAIAQVGSGPEYQFLSRINITPFDPVFHKHLNK